MHSLHDLLAFRIRRLAELTLETSKVARQLIRGQSQKRSRFFFFLFFDLFPYLLSLLARVTERGKVC
jgi:hypothetical protein